MTIKYYINGEIIKFSFASYSNSKMQTAFKKALKKRNIDINNHLLELGFSLKLCNICKTHYNPNINLEFKNQENDTIKISNIWYGRKIDDKILYDRFYCYGDNINCNGRVMNSNSVDFVAATLNLSKPDALSYIHINNKSPFYVENHNSLEDYKKSQSRGLSFFITKYGETIGLQKYAKYAEEHPYKTSKQYQIDKFGEKIGCEVWQKISEKKAITLANLHKKYGESIGNEKYDNWIASVSKSNLDLVELHGYDKAIKIIDSRNSKRLTTLNLNRGKLIIPKDHRFEYLIYSQMVWDQTKENILRFGLLKFGDSIKTTKLTIDHKFSIKYGFLRSVSPEIIGHIENLEYLSRSENSKKKDMCSIKLSQLLENIKHSKYGKL